MKRLPFTIMLFLLAMSGLQAQFQPGTLVLSGGFDIEYQSQDEGGASLGGTFLFGENVTVLGFSLNPSLGYFINERLAVGASLGYLYSQAKADRPNVVLAPRDIERRVNSFAIGPFLTYYRPINSRFGFLLDISGDLNFGRVTTMVAFSSSGDEKEEQELFNAGLALRPGFYYFLGDRFALSATIGGIGYDYNRLNSDEPGSEPNRNSRFYTFLDSGIGFGLSASLFFNTAPAD